MSTSFILLFFISRIAFVWPKYYAEVGLCLTRDEQGVEYKLNCLNSASHFCCKKTSGKRSLKFCCDYETYLANIFENFFSISLYFLTVLVLTVVLIGIHLFFAIKPKGSLEKVPTLDTKIL